jgi:hypothetical protein
VWESAGSLLREKGTGPAEPFPGSCGFRSGESGREKVVLACGDVTALSATNRRETEAEKRPSNPLGEFGRSRHERNAQNHPGLSPVNVARFQVNSAN